MDNEYHRGSPKLLHLYLRLGNVKDRLKMLETEQQMLEAEKIELEAKINDENEFLDSVDFAY
jgi:hypothetical protein